MARVITQLLVMNAGNIDGILQNQSGTAGALNLNGGFSSINPYNGNNQIDISDRSLASQLQFVTGLTGSVATVTIIGRNQYGNPVTENVAMPGGLSSVDTVQLFSFIESMTIDGSYSSLSCGTSTSLRQFGKWVPWDTHRRRFLATIDADEIVAGADFTLQHTIQQDLLTTDPDPTLIFSDPLMTGETVDSQIQLNIPVTASRIVMNTAAPSGATVRVKFLQIGRGR